MAAVELNLSTQILTYGALAHLQYGKVAQAPGESLTPRTPISHLAYHENRYRAATRRRSLEGRRDSDEKPVNDGC